MRTYTCKQDMLYAYVWFLSFSKDAHITTCTCKQGMLYTYLWFMSFSEDTYIHL